MSAPLRNFGARKLLSKQAHPAILPLPAQQSGNNKPFSLKKTRRNWKPNVHIMNMPVNILGGAPTIAQNLANLNESKFVRGPHLKRVKLAARDKKTVDKAGGVEGLLVSIHSIAAERKAEPRVKRLRNYSGAALPWNGLFPWRMAMVV
jgi:ribosomal protein L28